MTARIAAAVAASCGGFCLRRPEPARAPPRRDICVQRAPSALRLERESRRDVQEQLKNWNLCDYCECLLPAAMTEKRCDRRNQSRQSPHLI